MSVILDLDEQALASLPLGPGERERHMQIELACRFYASGWLTLGMAARMAGLDHFAFGVALFPSFDPRRSRYTPTEMNIGFIHTAFAALMFLVLAYFCIFLFRRSSPEKPFTRRKRYRNRIYGICGLIIAACMFLMVTLTISRVLEGRHPSHLLFWCESLALAAFGVAWLTKGEGILRDKPRNHIHNHLPSPAP